MTFHCQWQNRALTTYCRIPFILLFGTRHITVECTVRQRVVILAVATSVCLSVCQSVEAIHTVYTDVIFSGSVKGYETAGVKSTHNSGKFVKTRVDFSMKGQYLNIIMDKASVSTLCLRLFILFFFCFFSPFLVYILDNYQRRLILIGRSGV